MTGPYAIAVLIDGVADLSVLHEPAALFAEPPLKAAAHCGATGYVYLRDGLPATAAACVDCARVKAGGCVVGSMNRYNNGCRCDKCKEASREYRLRRRMENAGTCEDCGGPVLRPGSRRCWGCFSARGRGPLPEHGSNARYARGCRCEPCSQAHRVYMSEWRETRKVVAA